jgi:carbohydrate-selective porin OprB
LVGNGWIPSRAEGQFGIGFTQAHNSDKYMTTSPTSDRNEYGFELYYRDTVANGIVLQPDFQYIINPGSTAGVDNATILGLRTDISL